MKLSVKESAEVFFQSWKDRKWDKMFEVCQKTWGYTKTEEDLEEQFSTPEWKIKDYKITGFTNVSNVKRSYTIELTFADGRIERHAAILICEKAPYSPAAFGDWGVNPVSVLRNFGTIKAKTSTIKAKTVSK
jgi:hypothetical protein